MAPFPLDVAAKRLRRVPEEYAACFGVLEEAGVIGAALAERLKAMARFRNLLVHLGFRYSAARRPVKTVYCEALESSVSAGAA